MAHVGMVVEDLPAAGVLRSARAGALGEGQVEDLRVGRVIGLDDVRAEYCVPRMGVPEVELSRFLSPPSPDSDSHAPANAPGIRHLSFIVDDIDAAVAGLRARGTELVGEVENCGEQPISSATSPRPRGHHRRAGREARLTGRIANDVRQQAPARWQVEPSQRSRRRLAPCEIARVSSSVQSSRRTPFSLEQPFAAGSLDAPDGVELATIGLKGRGAFAWEAGLRQRCRRDATVFSCPDSLAAPALVCCLGRRHRCIAGASGRRMGFNPGDPRRPLDLGMQAPESVAR